jgi:hypothetical protein
VTVKARPARSMEYVRNRLRNVAEGRKLIRTRDYLVLVLLLSLAACSTGPEMPTGPIKFQCYDQATGQWEDCPEILDEDMKCHEEAPDVKEQA